MLLSPSDAFLPCVPIEAQDRQQRRADEQSERNHGQKLLRARARISLTATAAARAATIRRAIAVVICAVSLRGGPCRAFSISDAKAGCLSLWSHSLMARMRQAAGAGAGGGRGRGHGRGRGRGHGHGRGRGGRGRRYVSETEKGRIRCPRKCPIKIPRARNRPGRQPIAT